jgi:hypothetical protein
MARLLLALTAVAVIVVGYVVRSLLKGYTIRSRMHNLVSVGGQVFEQYPELTFD